MSPTFKRSCLSAYSLIQKASKTHRVFSVEKLSFHLKNEEKKKAIIKSWTDGIILSANKSLEFPYSFLSPLLTALTLKCRGV